MRNNKKSLLSALFAGFILLGGVAFAASDTDFSQTINAGTLAADIKDASRVTVANPAVSMSSKSFSFDCQAGGSASTGTFGTNSERIYVSNGDAADNGWSLTLAASDPTDTWANGGVTSEFDFNDPTGSTAGCSDGADTDSESGQMTVDPSGGTLTADCGSCVTTNVSKGASDAFEEGATDDITILNAAGTSDDIWRGYLTGASVSQTIPAETPADTYTINLTLTATAS